jgi:hypothetical protein
MTFVYLRLSNESRLSAKEKDFRQLERPTNEYSGYWTVQAMVRYSEMFLKNEYESERCSGCNNMV